MEKVNNKKLSLKFYILFFLAFKFPLYVYAVIEDITDVDLSQRLIITNNFKLKSTRYEFCVLNQCQNLVNTGSISFDQLEDNLNNATDLGILEKSGMARQAIVDGSENPKIVSSWEESKRPDSQVYFFAKSKSEDKQIVVFCETKGVLKEKLNDIKKAKQQKEFQFKVAHWLNCGGFPKAHYDRKIFTEKIEEIKKVVNLQKQKSADSN